MESARVRVFGEQAARIIGTFPDHVLVLAEDGRCKRLFWTQVDGACKIEHVENVNLRCLESREAFEESRAQFVGASGQALLAELALVRPWRHVVQRSRSKIASLLGHPKIEEAAFAKYAPLYEGVIGDVADDSSVASVIRQDIRYLQSEVTKLSDSVGSCHGNVVSVIESLGGLENRSDLAPLVYFSEDLVADLGRLQQVTGDVLEMSAPYPFMGHLLDQVNASLPEYKFGSQFVETMSRRLRDVTNQEIR